MARAREFGWSKEARYELTANICGEGIRSVKRVPKDKVDALLAALELGERSAEQLVAELLSYGDALDIRQQVEAALSQHPDDREWLERQVTRLRQRWEEQQGAA